MVDEASMKVERYNRGQGFVSWFQVPEDFGLGLLFCEICLFGEISRDAGKKRGIITLSRAKGSLLSLDSRDISFDRLHLHRHIGLCSNSMLMLIIVDA